MCCFVGENVWSMRSGAILSVRTTVSVAFSFDFFFCSSERFIFEILMEFLCLSDRVRISIQNTILKMVQ